MKAGNQKKRAKDLSLRRVLVVYNTDYDAELTAPEGVDVSAVEEAAVAARAAIGDYGFDADIIGIHGRDLDVVYKGLQSDPPDLVFNLCESLYGDVRNEPLFPALLDMLQIPYTGADPMSLGLCLHKDRAKEILLHHGVRTPPYVALHLPADLDAPFELDYPYFLKLLHEDASIGIGAANVVRDRQALIDRARELMTKYRQGVLAEQFIPGREVNVTVIGADHALDCLPLHEIDFSEMPDDRPNIISYAAKWDEQHVDYAGTKVVPIRDLTPELEQAIRETSFAAFRALGLRDFGRVDLRIDPAGQPWVIDVNPNCDLSPDAGVALAAKFGGIDYPQLLGRICEIAWSRSQ